VSAWKCCVRGRCSSFVANDASRLVIYLLGPKGGPRERIVHVIIIGLKIARVREGGTTVYSWEGRET
jgi:hypothetical protein